MLRYFLMVSGFFFSINGIPFEDFEPAWKSHLAKHGLGRGNFSRAADYPASVELNGNTYSIPNIQFLNGPPRGAFAPPPVVASSAGPTVLTLIPGGIVDSDVKCGGDNRNFCNYPELPFIETLNIPAVLAGPNRLNRLPSGRCPDGYSKLPTMDCLNIAAAFIETTCCVYNTPPVSLPDYCTNRAGLLFSASFELCDGRNFIIAGSNAWQVDDTFRILGGPYGLSTLTGGTVSSGVDSALVDSSCNVGFFVGKTLKWMNFPGKPPGTDQTLAALLGTINSNLCGGAASCVPTMVNFAVCPNNGYCMVSVTLLASTGTTYKQLFFLAPGFNSFISAMNAPPGIAVMNQYDLASNYRSYIAATYIKTTNQIAFIDTNNNVFFYDAVGRLISGPTNLFDLFGVCGNTGSTLGSGAYTIYVPYPVYGPPPNGTYGAGPPDYQAPSASASYGPPPQQMVNYGPPPAPASHDKPYGAPPPQTYQPPPTPPDMYRTQPAPPPYDSNPQAPSYVSPPDYVAPPPTLAPYQPPPASQYQPAAPSGQYQPPSPGPQYQPAPPATQPPVYQPAPPPYQSPTAPPVYPVQQYNPPPQPAPYQPPVVTPATQPYQDSPLPYLPPSPPAPPPRPAPYQSPPQQYQPSPIPPPPSPYQASPSSSTVVQSSPEPQPPQPPSQPATPKEATGTSIQQVERPPEALTNPPSKFPPQGPPIRKRTPAPPPANPDPVENTVFKPTFEGPHHEFFDVSAFIRKGDLDRFQPTRELKLV